MIRGPIPTTTPVGNMVNFTTTPGGNRAITLNHYIFVNFGCKPNFSLIGYVEVGFLKRYLILVQTHRYLNAVVNVAPAGNQIKLDWADKLGLGQAN